MDEDRASEAVALNRRQSVHEDILPEETTISGKRSLQLLFFSQRKIFRFMVYCMVAFIVACVVLAAFSFYKWKVSSDRVRGAKPKTQTMCYSNGCNETGYLTIKNINTKAKPCQDFEEFACGGWRKEHGQTVDSQFSLRRTVVAGKVQCILEHPVEETDGVPLRLAKSFYNQCTDLPALEKVGKGPILALLRQFGGWPSLEGPSWESGNFSLFKSLGFADQFLQFAPFISVAVVPDYNDKYSMVIVIHSPNYLLDQGLYRQSPETRAKVMSDLKSKYVNLALRLSGKYLDAYEDDARNVASLEEILVKASDSENASARFYESLDDLIQDAFDSPHNESSLRLNLQSVLDEVIFSNNVAAGLVHDKTVLPVKVEDISYLKQLVKVIESTPPRVLANYLHFIVASKLSEETLKYPEYSQLNETAQATVLKERKDHCRIKALTAFKMAIGAEYVRQHSHETLRYKEVELMALNIKAVFRETLAGASWLSETLREFLINKLDAMSIHVGFPHWILNDTLLLDEYNGLFLGSTYFDTVLNVTGWLTDKAYSECHLRDAWTISCGTFSDIETVNEEELTAFGLFYEELPAFYKYGLLSVNAYHNLRENAIVIPAGIIGSPIYDDGEQRLTKYARTGFLIAHEIAHGIDDLGLLWSANGTVTTDHFTDEDSVELRQKRQCLAAQYADFRLTLRNESFRFLNGVENTADNVAVVMAYRAYRKWIESENGGRPEHKLPYLEHWTPDQLFFLSYAMTWCESEAFTATARDHHSPGKLRATVPLQNSPEFAKAWNCKLETKMNPKRKCMDL